VIEELEYAGIELLDLSRYSLPVPPTSREVGTTIIGTLEHGWEFKRAWRYWVATGPGIPPDIAMEMWNIDKTIRVDGHCASPSPLEWFHGFAVGNYHVDTWEGLKLLAENIKGIYVE
jgi:hypothetical protein